MKKLYQIYIKINSDEKYFKMTYFLNKSILFSIINEKLVKVKDELKL